MAQHYVLSTVGTLIIGALVGYLMYWLGQKHADFKFLVESSSLVVMRIVALVVSILGMLSAFIWNIQLGLLAVIQYILFFWAMFSMFERRVIVPWEFFTKKFYGFK